MRTLHLDSRRKRSSQESFEYRQDRCGQIFVLCFAFKAQVVTGAFDRKQLRFRGNHFQSLLQLGDRAEGVARTRHEQRWRAQVGEVLGALLLGLARGMERVGEQEQRGDQARLFGAEHAGLASAVGVTAEKNFARHQLFHRGNRVLQPGAIAGGVAGAGGTEGSHLPIREITTQNGEPGGAEGLGERDQQRGLGV